MRDEEWRLEQGRRGITEIIRIRRVRPREDGHAEWFIGCDKKGAPVFQAVAKEDARICRSKASASALLGMKGYEGAVVDVEEGK